MTSRQGKQRKRRKERGGPLFCDDHQRRSTGRQGKRREKREERDEKKGAAHSSVMTRRVPLSVFPGSAVLAQGVTINTGSLKISYTDFRSEAASSRGMSSGLKGTSCAPQACGTCKEKG